MKKTNLLFLFVLTVLTFSKISAQFTSVKDGEWRVASTWSTDINATALPDSNSSVVVNHTLSTVGGDVCKDLTIYGKVWGGEYLHIYGDLINKGELRDDPNHGSDYLTVTINGSIINDGLYITGTTNFEGNRSHHLQTLNGNTINFGSAFGRNSEVDFIIDGVAYISGNLLLGGSKMILPGGYVTPDTLILNNGLIDGGIFECNNNVILGMGVNSTIGFSGVFSEQQHTFVKDAILEGYLKFNGITIDSSIGSITFLGNIVNNGTLVNATNNSTVFVEGDITNNGKIVSVGTHPDHGIKLEFKNGNLINNGVLKNRIVFYNSHTFTNNSDSIGVQTIGGIDSNTIISVVGDLVFNTKIIGDYVFNYEASINMSGGKIVLPNNGKLINFGMDNTVLNANSSLLENAEGLRVKTSTIENAKIKYLKTNNPTTFTGEIEIIEEGNFEGNATLNCNITNNGNMNVYNTITGNIINNGNWNASNNVIGNITNTGIIDNSLFEISGNVVNEGSWNSNQILLNGTEDQFISMPTDSAINSSSVKFNAMLEGTNYQWTRNGDDISGENSNTITFTTGLLPDNATYQCIVDGNNSRSIIIQSLTDVEEGNDVLPTEYSLLQNYPNPFNPSTEIEFAIPTNGNVSLKVFNSIGEEVVELLNSEMVAGYHSVNFNASTSSATKLSSGIYFYRISVSTSAKGINSETGSATFTKTNKMLLLK